MSSLRKPARASFTIDYTGPILSINEYHTGWRKLHARKKAVTTAFSLAFWQLRPRPPRLAWMELTVFHNTGLDIDNLTGTIKPCVDALRSHGVLPDDTAKRWDRLTIIYDPALPKSLVRFEVIGEEAPGIIT
jgi:hypothetical protein